MISGQFFLTRPCKVFIDGKPLRLGPSKQYLNEAYSFRWGTPSDGALQLSFALLLYCCGAKDAMDYYHMFASDVLYMMPIGDREWMYLFEDDIKNFVARKKDLNSKSRLKTLYWKLLSPLLFTEDFYENYIKPNTPYEDWWSLRPSTFISLVKF